jgi:hypothetical protein
MWALRGIPFLSSNRLKERNDLRSESNPSASAPLEALQRCKEADTKHHGAALIPSGCRFQNQKREASVKPRHILGVTNSPQSGPKALIWLGNWSGRRDSNPRPQPWQGCALPLSYTRSLVRPFGAVGAPVGGGV